MADGPKVRLTKRVEITGAGLRYCPVVMAKNGRVKTDFVLVDGEEERHADGSYYLDWVEKGKRVRRAVGDDGQEALNAYDRQQSLLNAIANGVVVAAPVTTPKVVPDTPANDVTMASPIRETPVSDEPKELSIRLLLSEAIDIYLADINNDVKNGKRKRRTWMVYTADLRHFRHSCPEKHISQINSRDVSNFEGYLRRKKMSDRSILNKKVNLATFLKKCGVVDASKNIVGKLTKIDKTEEAKTPYSAEEMKKLYAACNETEKTWWMFFVLTGMREQEVMHTYWSDIDWKTGKISVTSKPDLNWTAKTKKSETRKIKVVPALLDRLAEMKTKANGCKLVFPTSGCKPKRDFLDCLKAIVHRAGLNCGECDGCQKDWCEHWYLHKFRATFCKNTYEETGHDLLKTAKLMGHENTDTTELYIKTETELDDAETQGIAARSGL